MDMSGLVVVCHLFYAASKAASFGFVTGGKVGNYTGALMSHLRLLCRLPGIFAIVEIYVLYIKP